MMRSDRAVRLVPRDEQPLTMRAWERTLEDAIVHVLGRRAANVAALERTPAWRWARRRTLKHLVVADTLVHDTLASMHRAIGRVPPQLAR